MLKKEYIGNPYRAGKLYTTEAREVLDRDFINLADEVIIPHGIYDLRRNAGFINLGNSRDTTEFAWDFPHVTRDCEAAIFTSIELVKSLNENHKPQRS